MYVIKKRGGGYVAEPGSRESYTNYLELAQKFYTRESAEKNSCIENECVMSIDDILDPRRG